MGGIWHNRDLIKWSEHEYEDDEYPKFWVDIRESKILKVCSKLWDYEERCAAAHKRSYKAAPNSSSWRYHVRLELPNDDISIYNKWCKTISIGICDYKIKAYDATTTWNDADYSIYLVFSGIDPILDFFDYISLKLDTTQLKECEVTVE